MSNDFERLFRFNRDEFPQRGTGKDFEGRFRFKGESSTLPSSADDDH